MSGGGARAVRWAPAVCLLCTLVVGCGDDGGSASDDLEIGGTATARGPVAWPAPTDGVAQLAESAGAPLERRETLVHHVHSHLDVFIDGEHRVVPAGIGIVITDPAVKVFEELSGTSYGGIDPPCDQPCISPLHTHDGGGVLHTESATDEARTLGQFFELWDVRLDDRCVADHCTPDTPIRIFVDGDEVPLADAPDIALTDGKEIAIVIGDPPDRIPSEADLSNA